MTAIEKKLDAEEVRAAEAKVIAAARLYAEWAKLGDYPHDEQGCEAHEAIEQAVAELEALSSSKDKEGG